MDPVEDFRPPVLTGHKDTPLAVFWAGVSHCEPRVCLLWRSSPGTKVKVRRSFVDVETPDGRQCILRWRITIVR